MRDVCIIHYGEIGLKGRNRNLFEQRLIQNLRQKLKEHEVRVEKRYGRIVLQLPNIPNRPEVRQVIERTFGVENFLFGYEVDQAIESIGAAAVDLLGMRNGWETFRIETKRSEKKFPLKSVQVNEQVGGVCLEAFPGAKVKLTKPDVTIHVEIADGRAYVLGTKHKGPGGMPVGTAGKVLCMLSGGIDSPVAAWYLMKRGCEVEFIHFHSMPYTDQASIDKVKELAHILGQWQGPSKMASVPFVDIQKQIVQETKGDYRILLYRRLMFKIAEQHAKQIGAKAIVTGESLAQVASQTLENIHVINDAVEIPVLRPLIGFDKSEIVKVAERVGHMRHPLFRMGIVVLSSHLGTRRHVDPFRLHVKRRKRSNRIIWLKPRFSRLKSSTSSMSTFYLVATPIGNLNDLSSRAKEVLASVDVILAEDTRVTGGLLSKAGIKTQMVSYHQQSHERQVENVLSLLEKGNSLALVTDAGTPGISDPGGKLVEAVVQRFGNEVQMIPIPGPSAVTAALSISGFPADKFVFMGFPPSKKGRQTFFDELASEEKTIVLYESTHRILKTLSELEARLGDRPIVACRELTKMHETIYRGTVTDVTKQLEAGSIKGEFVLVIRAT